MKKSVLLLSTSLLSLIAMNLFAATNATDLTGPVASKNHVYVEANLGYANITSPGKDATGKTTDAERGNAAFGVNLGYNYALNDQVSLGSEIGAAHDGYSEVKVGAGPTECAKIKSKDYRLLLTGEYRMGQNADVFAKAGVARVTQTMDSTSGLGNIPSIKETKPITTIGLGYMLNPRINFHVAYTHIFSKGNNTLPSAGGHFTNVDPIDSVTLGSSYLFPIG